MTEVIEATVMSPDEARKLTDQVKDDARALWAKLLDLKQRGAHIALGYANWAEYAKAEFDLGEAQAYRLVQSAEVVKVIEASNVQLDKPAPLPKNESVVRELKPLRRQPQVMAGAWQDAVERHGPSPTAEQVSQVVNETLERAKQARAAAKTAAASTPAVPASAPMPNRVVATVVGDEAGEAVREPTQDNGNGQPPAQAVPAEPAPEPLKNPSELSAQIVTMSNVLNDLKVDEYDLSDGDQLVELYGALLDIAFWIDNAVASVQPNVDKRRIRSRIKKLRSIEEPKKEVKIASALADRLEMFIEMASTP